LFATFFQMGPSLQKIYPTLISLLFQWMIRRCCLLVVKTKRFIQVFIKSDFARTQEMFLNVENVAKIWTIHALNAHVVVTSSVVTPAVFAWMNVCGCVLAQTIYIFKW